MVQFNRYWQNNILSTWAKTEIKGERERDATVSLYYVYVQIRVSPEVSSPYSVHCTLRVTQLACVISSLHSTLSTIKFYSSYTQFTTGCPCQRWLCCNWGHSPPAPRPSEPRPEVCPSRIAPPGSEVVRDENWWENITPGAWSLSDVSTIETPQSLPGHFPATKLLFPFIKW